MVSSFSRCSGDGPAVADGDPALYALGSTTASLVFLLQIHPHPAHARTFDSHFHPHTPVVLSFLEALSRMGRRFRAMGTVLLCSHLLIKGVWMGEWPYLLVSLNRIGCGFLLTYAQAFGEES